MEIKFIVCGNTATSPVKSQHCGPNCRRAGLVNKAGLVGRFYGEPPPGEL